MNKISKQLPRLIKEAEKDWNTLPHWTCPDCGAEILEKNKEGHGFLCERQQEINKKMEAI